MKPRKCSFFLTLIFTLTIFSSLISLSAYAKITGECVNCHTMHNSQGGAAMATYRGETGPNSFLTRGSCIGCHAQGTGNKIENIGGSEIPQVYHTDSSDLAGGNFKYIDDDDNRGHNVSDFGNIDNTLSSAPGHHSINNPTNETLTCAGHNGCHGYRRFDSGSGLPTLKGAHHGNVDGKCDTATTVANSYRFLHSVKGFENMGANKYQNLNATNHNEYYGANSPAIDNIDSCTTCHDISKSMQVTAPGNTISGFCGTCHSNFHMTDQIGGTASPFIRHPTDIVLKNYGEYASYTTFSAEAPIGRTTVPDAISSVVTPGTDVVTCLSCHAAHATNYPDLLRWDYDAMIAGGGGSDTGCFTCHTQKND